MASEGSRGALGATTTTTTTTPLPLPLEPGGSGSGSGSGGISGSMGACGAQTWSKFLNMDHF